MHPKASPTGVIEPVILHAVLPAGMLGPDPVSFDYHCFLVPHDQGVVLVDTGFAGSSEEIGASLARIGATWSDITDIVLTHSHPDHAGGLAEALALAPRAVAYAGAEDLVAIAAGRELRLRPLAEGDMVRHLRILHTAGHTPGHISLLDEAHSVLLLGDLLNTNARGVTFPPEGFSADPALNVASIRRVAELRPDRIMFSHGEELPDPIGAIEELLEGS